MKPTPTTGFAPIDGAQIYYETAGTGTPFIMLHAGVADHRQWNHEFAHFANHYRVVRFDQRGFGRSEPAAGEYSLLGTFEDLFTYLEVVEPAIIMGCSMGGGVAIDFALAYPDRVKALILVGSGPSGLELDVPPLEKFAEAEKAFKAGDLDLVAEIETQIWFDGMGRSADQVDPSMRSLAYEMNHLALSHEAKNLGKRQPGSSRAAEKIGDLKIPILVVVGEHDILYIQKAADYMLEHFPSAQKVMIADAAHLTNMDHPKKFRAVLTAFLDNLER